ncbi:MAG: Plug domain-containing protein, partial [Acinetobacter sp.]
MPQFLYWNSIKPFALTATVLAVTSLMNIQTHAASEHKASYYQVQTGTLTQALNNVAQQANVSVLFNPTRTNLYQVKSIQGQYTLDQLFARLIQNTPFKLQKTVSGYVLIEMPSVQQVNVIETNPSNLAKNSLSNTIPDNQIYQMPAIVLEAEKEDTVKFGQSVLNQKAIDRYQANNVAQLLDHMPSVSSAGSPRPGGQTINILGRGGVADVPITLDDSVKSFDK